MQIATDNPVGAAFSEQFDEVRTITSAIGLTGLVWVNQDALIRVLMDGFNWIKHLSVLPLIDQSPEKLPRASFVAGFPRVDEFVAFVPVGEDDPFCTLSKEFKRGESQPALQPPLGHATPLVIQPMIDDRGALRDLFVKTLQP